MSYILYGPQGSGKTTHAEKIRAKLRLSRVIEEDHPDFPRSVYHALTAPDCADRFKAMNALFITNEAPPPHLQIRRAIHINDALHMIGRA